MRRAVFVGNLVRGKFCFGVKLYPLIEKQEIKGSYYHKNCGGKIQSKWYCEEHGIVDFSEVERGFPVKDRIIYLSKKELESLKPDFPEKEIIVFYEQKIPLPPVFKKIFLVFPDKKDPSSEAFYFAYRNYLKQRKLLAIGGAVLPLGNKEKVNCVIFPQELFSFNVLVLAILPWWEEVEGIWEILKETLLIKNPNFLLEVKDRERMISKDKIDIEKSNFWPLFSDVKLILFKELIEKKTKR